MVFPWMAAATLGGSLVSGLGSLFGGSEAKSGAVRGGKIAARATLKAGRMNAAMQKLFARRGIRWRVRDAKKAGLHPLAALGAQTTSFAPSFVGATQAGQGVADGAAAMGQGITRATTAFGDAIDRAGSGVYLAQLQKAQLDNMNLQNQALASQIAIMNQPGQPPASPSPANRYLIDGQGQSVKGPLVQDQPLKRVAGDPARLSQEAGAVTDTGFLRTRTGWAPTRSADAAERLEDDVLGSIQHFVRNRIVQPLMDLDEGAPFPAPKGKYWGFNHITGEYVLKDGSPGFFKKTPEGWDFNF